MGIRYAVVGATRSEVDYTDENQETQEVRYADIGGEGGVGMGTLIRRAAFALRFGQLEPLISNFVTSDSRVFYVRDVRDRVEKLAPFLLFDADPYPVLIDGRILYVVDGYTTTDRFPGAEKDSYSDMIDDALADTTGGLQTIPTDQINYMRNAVKATVDAYDGTVTLYEWDTEDPLLQAWKKAFPGTVQDKESIPEELTDHLRYPEDLFKVQRFQLARYHVTDPSDWYQSNNRWEVPEDPYAQRTFQPPYRLFVDEPTVEGEDETFSLTSVYVPYQKNNLASFVSVDSDATSDTYGTMRVLELPNEQTPGPNLVANQFASDEEVAFELAQFDRSGARPVYGNLLTLPVNDGLMYVQPVYAARQLSDAAFPILRFVLTKYGDDIGIGSTLRESLQDLLEKSGGEVTPTPDPEPTPEPTPEPESTQNPPAIKNGSFDWDWTYEAPQCDGLVVAYPSNIPSGQANDVNIRLETDQGQVTLNYHLDQGTWSGTTAFVYSQHRLWPAGVSEYTVTWTQVGGSNYHWQGAVECALGEVSPETGTRNGYAVVRTPGTPATPGTETGTDAPDVVEGYRTGRTKVSKGQRVGSDIVVVRGLADGTVELQKQTKRGWKSIRTVTAKDGNAVVTYPKQRKKGKFSYRLTAGDYVSDVLTVKVR